MKAKVWNDSKQYDWVETFKGDKITIPKGEFIVMEYYEANDFRGQYSPIKLLGDGTQDPKTLKCIRLEKIEDDFQKEPELFQCNKCKKTFNSESQLVKHSESQHGDEVIIDDEIEKTMPKKRGRPPKQLEAHD